LLCRQAASGDALISWSPCSAHLRLDLQRLWVDEVLINSGCPQICLPEKEQTLWDEQRWRKPPRSPAWHRIQPHLFALTSLCMQQCCLMFIIDISLCMPLRHSYVSLLYEDMPLISKPNSVCLTIASTEPPESQQSPGSLDHLPVCSPY
jgi:hypothetical protein